MELKETAVQYMIRQLRYAYDAKKAGTFNGELDVDDVEYFGEIALKMENEQLNIARLDGINLANKGYGK